MFLINILIYTINFGGIPKNKGEICEKYEG